MLRPKPHYRGVVTVKSRPTRSLRRRLFGVNGSGAGKMAIFTQSMPEKSFSALSERQVCLKNYFPVHPNAKIASKIIFRSFLTPGLPPKSFSDLS